MNKINVEIYVLGSFNNEKHEREKISLGYYEDGDFPEMMDRILELTKCGLDIETCVERWSE